MAQAPKVFISYAPGATHSLWVRDLANHLRRQGGLNADLDAFSAKGERAEYLEGRLAWADAILFVVTPEYKQQFDGRQGDTDVGLWARLIAGQLSQKTPKPQRWAVVVREGSVEEAVPALLSGYETIDMTADPVSVEAFDRLVRVLRNEPAPKATIDGSAYQNREEARWKEAFETAYRAREAALRRGRRRVEALLAAVVLAVALGVTAWWWGRAPAEFIEVEPGKVTWTLPSGGTRTATLTHRYLVQRTEVTQRQWYEVMGNRPAYFQACGEYCPVERVSFFDALNYLNRRSAAEGLPACYDLSESLNAAALQKKACPAGDPNGSLRQCESDYRPTFTFVGTTCKGYRLATEAEWIHAARAGQVGPTAQGTNAKIKKPYNAPWVGRVAWYGGNSQAHSDWSCARFEDKQVPGMIYCGTQPVGRKAPNAWGLVDTLGNVWEWMHAEQDPQVAMDRGGGFFSKAERVQLDQGTPLPAHRRSFDLGFRAVKTGR